MSLRDRELWQRVHAHLDAGEDPLADDRLVEALADDPDELAAVVRTCGRLRALSASPAPGTSPRDARRVAARLWTFAIPITAAAIAVLWFVLHGTPTDEPRPRAQSPRAQSPRAQSPRAQSPRRSAIATITEGLPRVIAWHAVTVEHGADGRVERSIASSTSRPSMTSRQTTFDWTPPRRPDAHAPGVVSFVATLQEP